MPTVQKAFLGQCIACDGEMVALNCENTCLKKERYVLREVAASSTDHCNASSSLTAVVQGVTPWLQ